MCIVAQQAAKSSSQIKGVKIMYQNNIPAIFLGDLLEE